MSTQPEHIRFTARQTTDYNQLTPNQREEFHRLTDAGQPIPAALYTARRRAQTLLDEAEADR